MKDVTIWAKGISAAPKLMLYKKQMSRIASPTIRPTKGDRGMFDPLGELAIAFVIGVPSSSLIQNLTANCELLTTIVQINEALLHDSKKAQDWTYSGS